MPFQPLLQAQNEFWKLHRAATVKSVLNRLSRQPVQLCAFSDARKAMNPSVLGPRTLQEIPLRRIVGSVGRARDYTPSFLPRRAGDEARWVRVRQAVETSGLPPLELYRLGDDYFVQDGHHRVSVLRSLGVKTAEAYVIEVRAQVTRDARSQAGAVCSGLVGEPGYCPV